MKGVAHILLFFGLTILFLRTNGYTYTELLNTENGHCEGPGYGKIPVGKYGYHDENCEKVYCHGGYREVLGCGIEVDPKDDQCETVRGTGHYPDCCPHIRCT